MDRDLLAQAAADAKRPLKPVKESSPRSPPALADMAERTRMFTKMLSLYPTAQSQDPEALIYALLESTTDIPARWLSHALARLTREPHRKFAPTLGEIRGVAMRLIREARWRAQPGGRPPCPQGEPPLHESREIAWAAENSIPQLGPGSTPQQQPRDLRQPRTLELVRGSDLK
jgi:hypothetical protein